MNRKKGFTLIELMVVISIIAFLSSVFLASMNSLRQKAQDTKIKTQLIQMQNSGFLIYNNQQQYGTALYVGGCGNTLEAEFTDKGFYKPSNWPNIDNSIPLPICISNATYGGEVVTSYSLYFPLNNYNGFCVDSENNSIEGGAIPNSASCINSTPSPQGGTAEIGETCENNSDCSSAFCGYAFDYPNPRVCTYGNNGDLCMSNDQCLSGYCDGSNACSNI